VAQDTGQEVVVGDSVAVGLGLSQAFGLADGQSVQIKGDARLVADRVGDLGDPVAAVGGVDRRMIVFGRGVLAQVDDLRMQNR
jgi:hypothetical protein